MFVWFYIRLRTWPYADITCTYILQLTRVRSVLNLRKRNPRVGLFGSGSSDYHERVYVPRADYVVSPDEGPRAGERKRRLK